MSNSARIIENSKKIDELINAIKYKTNPALKPRGDYFTKVIDYNGTMLDEVWLNDGETYALPTKVPEHKRLIFQEWSATQDVVDNTIIIDGNDVMVGAIYTTKSGYSEFDIEITKSMVEDIETNGYTVTLNMDGNKWWTYDRDKTTSDTSNTHTYYQYGKYTIACDGTTITTNIMGQTSGLTGSLLKECHIVGVKSIPYQAFYYCGAMDFITLDNATTKIDRGAFVWSGIKAFVSPKITVGGYNLNNGMFGSCYNLESVVWNEEIGYNYFLQNRTLKNIVIPKQISYIGESAFNYCYSLPSITIPTDITLRASSFSGCYNLGGKINIYKSSYASVFNNCISLRKAIFEDGDISVANDTFKSCTSMEQIVFKGHVKSIGSGVLSNAYTLKFIDLSNCTAVPTLSSNAFGSTSYFHNDCKIIVPDALYDEWIVSTNWVTYSKWIYKASEVAYD